ncbi:MAG: hydrogenase [Sulfuritalea sp.]|nr:hydrogenase [Sulfuritalea sp.]
MSLSPDIERLNQRITFLQSRHGFQLLDGDSFAAFVAQPGAALVLFAEDPAKVPETWDLTVILPEAVARLDTAVRVGVLAPQAARALAARYGICTWPALLALRDGEYLGTVEGLKDWSAYGRLLAELLAAAPCRPPGIGIPVHNAGAGTHCH